MSKVVRLAGLEPATYGLEGCCSIQLSYKRMILALGGAPEGSRTPNPQIRSLVLYPIELRTLTIQIKKRLIINLVKRLFNEMGWKMGIEPTTLRTTI